MTRRKAFETAAGRRRKDPIVLAIDDVELRLVPSVDLADIGRVQDSLTKSGADDLPQSERLVMQKDLLVNALRIMVEPDDQHLIDAIYRDLDFAVLSEIIPDMVAEYVGAANPTKQPSSSTGSQETGDSSTATASPEA